MFIQFEDYLGLLFQTSEIGFSSECSFSQINQKTVTQTKIE